MATAAECDQAIVYIVDDDVSLRAALESLFRSVGLVVGSYGSTREFLEADRGDLPGCLVLDVRLPGINGLDFQDQLASLGIGLPVVFMTGYGDIPMSVRGIKAGAVDFLPKPFRDQDMLDAVMTAIDNDRQARQAGAALKALRDRYDSLSPREQQVMALVTAGRLNKQAAGDLDLSEITVKVHRGAAMRKMGARTLPDLVRMAEALQIKRP
ncbi:response regulator transcription factor [Sphingomonas sp. PR090111-T3T-6A]|uniref:response regulator transcription factor n=1 Tax=Sphingomonas sp. PR090111-T3T-6A TaxID=685778 RepID=UPI0003750475|nr:response regulator transcription factor [Sphingomonas sp. PR090111-T3T-6A]